MVGGAGEERKWEASVLLIRLSPPFCLTHLHFIVNMIVSYCLNCNALALYCSLQCLVFTAVFSVQFTAVVHCAVFSSLQLCIV